jgi:hypothetical protein
MRKPCQSQPLKSTDGCPCRFTKTGEKMFTEAQIKWAKDHDWFLEVMPDGGIMVLEVCTWNTGKVTKTKLCFYDFPSLKIWAGH